MEIEMLEKEWNKYSSLAFLYDKGINTPTFKLYRKDDYEQLEYLLKVKEYERVSIRSFNPVGRSMMSKHFPNTVFDEVLLGECRQLLEQGYHLIVSTPIDPKDCLIRGNIVYYFNNEWLIECAKSPGTVREMENLPSSSIQRFSMNPMSREDRNKVYEELGLKGLSVVNVAKHIYWGIPILLEWSVYKYPVGVRDRELIFWELRRA